MPATSCSSPHSIPELAPLRPLLGDAMRADVGGLDVAARVVGIGLAMAAVGAAMQLAELHAALRGARRDVRALPRDARAGGGAVDRGRRRARPPAADCALRGGRPRPVPRAHVRRARRRIGPRWRVCCAPAASARTWRPPSRSPSTTRRRRAWRAPSVPAWSIWRRTGSPPPARREGCRSRPLSAWPTTWDRLHASSGALTTARPRPRRSPS